MVSSIIQAGSIGGEANRFRDTSEIVYEVNDKSSTRTPVTDAYDTSNA